MIQLFRHVISFCYVYTCSKDDFFLDWTCHKNWGHSGSTNVGAHSRHCSIYGG